jgi:hypothetical protein
MKKIFLYLIIILSFVSVPSAGQKLTKSTTRSLEDLFGKFLETNNDSSRVKINDSIEVIIDSYVKSDSVFRHKFRNVRYLGQIMSRDSAIKIVTWNLMLAHNPSKYMCYVIRRQKGGNNNVYKLVTDYKQEPIKTDTTYTQKDWYGALYYEVRPFTIDGLTCWILLGIDYGNIDISRKLIDVLSFTPDDSLLFGKKWFDSGNKVKFREVFEYASNGMMSLRFKSDSSIVFDHLVPFSPEKKDDRQYYGPDYSNDAYNFIKGLWSLIINIEMRNKD